MKFVNIDIIKVVRNYLNLEQSIKQCLDKKRKKEISYATIQDRKRMIIQKFHCVAVQESC